MRCTAVMAAVILACAGCDSSPPPPASSPTSPTDGRTQAAARYLAALNARKTTFDTVSAACAVATTTPQLKSCWGTRAAAQQVFNVDFAAIAFPDAVRSDATALESVDQRLGLAMSGLAASDTPQADRKDDNIYASASADFLLGTQTLRNELGIPAAPPIPASSP